MIKGNLVLQTTLNMKTLVLGLIWNSVKGKGYNSKLSREEVEEYSARNFIYGESWLPETRFPFDLDIA